MISLELLDVHTTSQHIINCRQQLYSRVLPDTRPNCIFCRHMGSEFAYWFIKFTLGKDSIFPLVLRPSRLLQVLLWERKITLEKEMSGAQLGSAKICLLAIRSLSSVDFVNLKCSFDFKAPSCPNMFFFQNPTPLKTDFNISLKIDVWKMIHFL